MPRRSIYPFTAIVGQERMKRALILNAVNPSIGGVLIRGERGTAKSTAARALAALLPEIEVVADCRFGCDPRRPEQYCDECRDRVAKGEVLPIAVRQTRIVDLPVSATEDRVGKPVADIGHPFQYHEHPNETAQRAAQQTGREPVAEEAMTHERVGQPVHWRASTSCVWSEPAAWSCGGTGPK